ncbi:MAG: hypothetical protein M9951_10910 [Burkholderiaceae bacterium]|nr:hypothetical protein [Burkholderiaceae bacterium]MEB2320526.1 hypothetical protein [Pseudomonadota bacterium]
MLVLKLTLVPLLIAGVTMIGRRWGARIAGMFAAMPVVAGPIAMFLTLEQGTEFGAHAAVGAIAAVVALMAFFLGYAWASRRLAWPGALACSLVAWGIAASVVASLPSRIGLATGMALVALLVAPALMPPPESRPRLPVAPPRFDLPLRMLAGALLTLLVTAVASRVGEAWSGLLTAFPVITLVLGVFTHREAGPGQVAQLFRGMCFGLYAFCSFFVVLSLLLPRAGVAPAFIAASAAAVVVQGLTGRLLAHR